MKTIAELFACRFDGAKLRIISACILLALTLSVGFACSEADSIRYIRHAGYFFVLAGVVGFAVYLWYYLAAKPRVSSELRSVFWVALVTVGGGLWALLVHFDFGFKIAMDDYILASTAQNLHESREVYFTTRLVADGHAFRVSEGDVDKRLWLYPLIVSIAHDLTGFRIENSFVVNSGLLVLFLFGAFFLGWRIAGVPAGILSVLLWVSLPLLAQNGSGGGMELLNLLLLQVVIILSAEYLRAPSRSIEGALSLSAVLVAYTRYESVLFLLPILLIIIIGWRKCGRCLISIGSVFASVLLLPLLLQLKRYMGSPESWELTHGASRAFELSHIQNNFGHALNFFFSYDDTLANSLLVSVVGFVSLICLPLLLRRKIKEYIKERPAVVALLIFAPFIVLQLVLVLGFHASRFDSPFVSRYALPFHLLLVFATLLVADHITRQRRELWSLAIFSVFVYILGFTLPTNAKAIFSKRNFAITEQQWLESLSEETLREKSLIIDRFTVPWSLRGWVAMPPELASQNAALITTEVAYGRYPAIYFVERLYYSEEATFRPLSKSSEQLSARFESELIAEKSFRPFTLTRVWRLVRFLSPEAG